MVKGFGCHKAYESLSDSTARDAMNAWRAICISPEAIAASIAYAIGQPEDVDVGEIIVRPTASPH
ncbi:hypothetical protein GCM10010837_14700 [Aminobacter niigataensis]